MEFLAKILRLELGGNIGHIFTNPNQFKPLQNVPIGQKKQTSAWFLSIGRHSHEYSALCVLKHYTIIPAAVLFCSVL